MVIDFLVFVAVVAAMGVATVKFFEWRQGVLHGRYHAPQTKETKWPASDREDHVDRASGKSRDR